MVAYMDPGMPAMMMAATAMTLQQGEQQQHRPRAATITTSALSGCSASPRSVEYLEPRREQNSECTVKRIQLSKSFQDLLCCFVEVCRRQHL